MQSVLLQRGLCPACTRRLSDLKNRDSRPNGTSRIECECGRIFIYDNETENFRRALLEEA